MELEHEGEISFLLSLYQNILISCHHTTAGWVALSVNHQDAQSPGLCSPNPPRTCVVKNSRLPKATPESQHRPILFVESNEHRSCSLRTSVGSTIHMNAIFLRLAYRELVSCIRAESDEVILLMTQAGLSLNRQGRWPA